MATFRILHCISCQNISVTSFSTNTLRCNYIIYVIINHCCTYHRRCNLMQIPTLQELLWINDAELALVQFISALEHLE